MSSSLDQPRIRLVVMGDSFVGKSAIVRRFLFGTFAPKYTATVEDLFSRDFDLAGADLKVDILDTAGDAQFPAMRRLSIASAHAFLLVYSVTDPTSLSAVKQHVEEIREQRKDFQDIPIVIAGNKIDLVREVDRQEVLDWVEAEMPKERTGVIECSASDNSNVFRIFKTFLHLAKINLDPTTAAATANNNDGRLQMAGKSRDDFGLRRNLSAYGRLKSPVMPPKSAGSRGSSPTPTSQHQQQGGIPITRKGSSGSGSPVGGGTPRAERKFLGLSLSPFGSPHGSGGKQLEQLEAQFKNSQELGGGFALGRNSKRSRSLIRRSSKKVKQQVNSVHNPEDCIVS